MRFKFAKGDRVDFIGPNGTPGTIRNRVHGETRPLYRVDWDDGWADDPDPFEEYELIPWGAGNE